MVRGSERAEAEFEKSKRSSVAGGGTCSYGLRGKEKEGLGVVLSLT